MKYVPLVVIGGYVLHSFGVGLISLGSWLMLAASLAFVGYTLWGEQCRRSSPSCTV